MSNLIKHAENEMRLAGLYSEGADYGGMIPGAVMALVRAHSEQGHSGASHGLTLQIFNRVINFKTLTPISSDPSEWMEVGGAIYQNRRQSSCFSNDGGKTYYDIDDPNREIKTSQPLEPEPIGSGKE